MMGTIDKNKCTEIGYVKKTHGIQGELLINFDDGYDEVFDQIEFLFFEIDGLPVPFFMESAELRGNNSAAVKFMFLDSKEKAQEYVGSKIFIDNNDVILDETEFNAMLLKGFTVTDVQMGTIGTITEVDDFGGNLVLTVNYNDSEIMLPLNDELITAFDKEKRTIEMDLPMGLFTLNE